MKDFLIKSKYNGIEINECEITLDEYFTDNYQLDQPLSKFFWIKIIGKKGKDDFFIDENLELYVLDNFISKYQSMFSSKYLEINPERTDTDDFLDNLFKV